MQYRTPANPSPHMQVTNSTPYFCAQICMLIDAPVQFDPVRKSAGSTAGAENEVKRMLKADTHILIDWGFRRSILTVYEGFVWV